MNADLINLLINAGVAGVFAIFGIVLIREVTKFLTDQNNLWVEFLRQERDSRIALWTRVDESLRNLDKAVSDLRNDVTSSSAVTKENAEATKRLARVLENGVSKGDPHG